MSKGLLLATTILFCILAHATTSAAENELGVGWSLVHGPILLRLGPEERSATFDLQLKHGSVDPAPLALTVTDFTSKTTDQILGTQIRLLTAEGKPLSESLTVTGKLALVRVEATNLWEAGEMEAQILNGTNWVGRITAFRDRAPFKLKPMNPPNGGEVVFGQGTQAYLTLTNEDAMTYVFDWALRVGNGMIEGTNGFVAPHSTTEIRLAVPDDWFSPVRPFKDDTKEGSLVLKLRPRSTVASVNWPERTFPFSARLQYRFGGLATLAILGLLLLGAMFSLALNLWVPNQLKKSRIEEELHGLKDKVRGLSCQIDSRPRVAADVELSRIEADLRSRYTWSPDFVNDLERLQKQLPLHASRIELLLIVDGLHSQMVGQASRAGSAFTERALEHLAKAAQLLASIQLTENIIAAAKKSIDAAAGWVETGTEQQKAFADELASLIKYLLPLAGGSSHEERYVPFRAKLKHLFDELTVENADPAKIRKERLGEIYFAANGLEILRSYVAARENRAPNEKDIQIQNALARGTCDGLRDARRLLLEARGAPDGQEVVEAIASGSVTIVSDPVIRQNRTARFAAEFWSKEFQAAAAAMGCAVEWDFDDGFQESGWEVAHYFAKPGDYAVTARFRLADGKRLQKADGTEIVSGKALSVIPTERPRFREKTWAEAILLCSAILIAVIGLLGGAKDQVVKLDFEAAIIAVFLLGFTADTIKNLLTKKS